MIFLRLFLSPICFVALVACNTYGDPDLSTGYFDWAPHKSNKEVFQPRRAALQSEQAVSSSLRAERSVLDRRLAHLNNHYSRRKQAGADDGELEAIRREINNLKKQLEVLTAQ